MKQVEGNRSMSLKKYRPRVETILAGEETVALRGLNVNDVSILLDAHRPMIEQMVGLMNDMEQGTSLESRVDRLIVESIQRAPDLVAGIICLAADEPDAADQAKSLPFAVQVEALVHVFTLTFQETGGLGNFLAVLRRVLDGAKALKPLQASPIHN
jgi:hypothetical protein